MTPPDQHEALRLTVLDEVERVRFKAEDLLIHASMLERDLKRLIGTKE